jgi:threonine/homoserine/homoserine lactone efflux protein
MMHMIDHARFLVFISAAVMLAISPGPGLMYVLARSLRGGRTVGLASSIGTAVGGMMHVIAAGFGLSVFLARSASAFLIVKYAGAAYLVYLGFRMLRQPGGGLAVADSTIAPGGASNPFWQGVLTEVLNPKTALFFLAFIPQFVDHSAPVIPQFLTLGAISVLLNTTADIAVVLAAAQLERRMRGSKVWQNRQRMLSGASLIGLGGYVAAS